MSKRQRKTKRSIRSLLNDKREFLTLPGVFDALSAKIAEKIGYPAIFQTGYGSAGRFLGCRILVYYMQEKQLITLGV